MSTQLFGVILGDTALWQVLRDFIISARNKSLTYSPTNVVVNKSIGRAFLISPALHRLDRTR